VSELLAAVRARRGHFALESGHHGNLWLDLETLCARPASVWPFAKRLAGRLRPYDVDVVCGPLNEGAFVALMVATELGCDFAYAERLPDPAAAALFPVDYRLPAPLHATVSGRRVAIVNDVTSAGSAVRGAFAHLQTLGARIVVIGSLLVFGTAIDAFAEERRVPIEPLERLPYSLWIPADCPLCRSKIPLE